MFVTRNKARSVYPEDISCICDPVDGKGGIFVSNLEAAENINTLKRLQIRAVLTAAKGVTLSHSKTDVPWHLTIPAEDHDAFDISRYFQQAIAFISDSIRHTNILVHCLAGVSRSVSLVLAYLIKCRGMGYETAFSMLKNRRKIIHPNDGFIDQLRKLERDCRKADSVDTNRGSKYTYSPSPTKYPQERYTASRHAYADNVFGNQGKRNDDTRYGNGGSYAELKEQREQRREEDRTVFEPHYNIFSNSRHQSKPKGSISPPKNPQFYSRFETKEYDQRRTESPSRYLQNEHNNSMNYSVKRPVSSYANLAFPIGRMTNKSSFEYEGRGKMMSDYTRIQRETKPNISLYERREDRQQVQSRQHRNIDQKILQIRRKYQQYSDREYGYPKYFGSKENEGGTDISEFRMKKMNSQEYDSRMFGHTRNNQAMVGIRKISSYQDYC